MTGSNTFDLFQEKPVMEWFTKAAGQSVNNLKFSQFNLEEMVSVQ